jgi:hypothetical protein
MSRKLGESDQEHRERCRGANSKRAKRRAERAQNAGKPGYSMTGVKKTFLRLPGLTVNLIDLRCQSCGSLFNQVGHLPG